MSAALPAGTVSLTGRRSTAAYLTLLGLGTLDAAGYSVIAPVLPALSARLEAGPLLVGLLVATFPAGMVGGFGFAGLLVRWRGPRLAVWVGLVLAMMGSVGFLLADAGVTYAVARTVMGIGSGCLWLGVTFATLQCWPDQGYVCMSRIFAAYSVGGLVGPLLGALTGIRAPFAAYAALTVLVAVPAVLLPVPARRVGFASDRRALGSRGFWVAAVGIAFAVMALGTLEGVLPLHLATGLAQAGIGAVYAGVAVIVAVSAAVTARVPPRRALAVATVPVVAGLTLAGVASTAPLWLVALAVAGAGVGMANTAAIGVLLEAVPTTRIVTAMVVWSQLGIIGYLLAPVLGGAVVTRLGYGAAAIPTAAVALIVGLALAMCRHAQRS